jgi:phospholipid/cholesterol/gamma-HCH transport system substrate-binding protein
MTVVRGFALAGICVALAVVAVVLLSGGGGTEYKVRFQNASQLVKDNDVQIGGRRIGSVRGIKLTDDNEAEVTIVVEDGYTPLHRGTTASVRLGSLSGQANRYIQLAPGPNNAPALDDGAVLAASSTTSTVDLDQVFNALDEKTRAALQDVIKGSAQQYAGVTKEANTSAKYFNPALNTTSRLTNELIRDQQAFENFVVDTSKVMTTLASKRDDLSALVSNANQTASAIGSQNRALSDALGVLPTTLRRANTTFVNLRSTLGDLDRLVAASKPATKDLAPFLRELRPLVTAARPTIADLRALIRKPGANNDLIELLRKTPTLERTAKPAFANSIQALQKATPVVAFARPYAPDFIGWIRDFSQTTANYDANGHFARIQPIFNQFNLNQQTNTLVPQPSSQRLSGFQQGQFRRCPGASTNAPADGSAPWRDTNGKLDCDPTDVVGGP